MFHVQVRMAGYPARTASFKTRRLAERWAKTLEAEMIEGKHFRSAEARPHAAYRVSLTAARQCQSTRSKGRLRATSSITAQAIPIAGAPTWTA